MTSYRVEWYHQVPPHVKEILRTLHENGHMAYIVGGAVRDLWLGLQPKDFDIASDASVDEIAALFPKTLAVGKQFGIMVIVTEAGSVEVARFRTDGEYTDNRHPSTVAFTDPAKDAERRDFTINALFYDTASGSVIDYVNGVADLDKKIIRTVGDAADRFAEDALRMLRAFRFFAQIPGAQLDPPIYTAVSKHHASIKHVSRERVTQEFLKLLEGAQNESALLALSSSPLWPALFDAPPWTPTEAKEAAAKIAAHRAHGNTIDRNFLLTLLCDPNFSLNLTALLLPKAEAEKIRAMWKVVTQLHCFERLDLAEQKSLAALDGFETAWSLAFGTHISKAAQTILEKKRAWESSGVLRPEPLLRAEDLLALGLKPGPKFGEILGAVRTAQLLEKIHAKNQALCFVKENFLASDRQ